MSNSPFKLAREFDSPLFRTLADIIPSMLWVTDCQGQTVFINQRWVEFTGLPLEAHLGNGWVNCLHPEDRSRSLSRFQKALKEVEPIELEYRIRRHDGMYRWMRDCGAPVLAPDGNCTCYVGGCIDIDDHMALQQGNSASHAQLTYSQRLESLGQISMRVAHDTNNMLGVIRGHLQLIERLRGDEERLQRSLGMALIGCEQGATLLKKVLDYGAAIPSPRVVVPARSLAERAIEFARALMASQIEFAIGAGGEQLVDVDSNEILQVFTNIFINAQHAMPNGGSLAVTFEPVQLANAAEKRPWAVPGSYIAIRVKDTGTGIPREVLPKIFEPFFTTKPPGQGTGLGLSVSFNIARRHLGWLEAAPAAEGGAVVSLVLPVV